MKITPCIPKTLSELHQAPVLVHNVVEINSSAERLFAILEDEHAWTVWAGSITKVVWTSPKPFGVGTTRVVDMVGGIVGVEEFIAWEDNKQMAFCFTEASMPNLEAFGEDYVIESLGPNRIRAHWYVGFWPSNIAAKIGFTLFKPMMKLFLGKYLKQLKAMCEGDYQPKPAAPVVPE